MEIKTKLSMLWIVLLFNLILADILSILIELVEENTLDIIEEVETTMTIAAFITNIAMLMIYFSRELSYKAQSPIKYDCRLHDTVLCCGRRQLNSALPYHRQYRTHLIDHHHYYVKERKSTIK